MKKFFSSSLTISASGMSSVHPNMLFSHVKRQVILPNALMANGAFQDNVGAFISCCECCLASTWLEFVATVSLHFVILLLPSLAGYHKR